MSGAPQERRERSRLRSPETATGVVHEAQAQRPLLVALRALGLGDLLTAVPALRALAEAFPDHRRVLAAPAALAPLARLIAAIEEVVDTAPLESLPSSLAHPEVAVNLHGRGPQSHRRLLATCPRRLIAFGHPDVAESAGMPHWVEDEHEVARWCRMLRESGIPADASRLDLPPSDRPVPRWMRGATIIHPGGKPSCRWPPERWAEVARAEHERGRTVLVTGGPGEVELAAEVAHGGRLPPRAVLAARTDLLDLAALVAAAGRVVCGDTGIAHLATAFGSPSVVLFGPLSPAEWGPPPDRPWHRALWAGRRGEPHAVVPHQGLLDIDVGLVLAELDRLPPRSPDPSPPPSATAHHDRNVDQDKGQVDPGQEFSRPS
ncbi:MAG: glycosyltransferase family 9 protein [Actinomycetota bacterium]|nr:glycosyltransferase family 9 protein [Actinomycetota bacterium]